MARTARRFSARKWKSRYMCGQTSMRTRYEWNLFNSFKTINRFAPFKPFRRIQPNKPPTLLLPRARGGGPRRGLNGLNDLNGLNESVNEVRNERHRLPPQSRRKRN